MLIHITTWNERSRIVPKEDEEPVTFASLAFPEADIEALLQPPFYDGDERSLLIIGQQVKNALNFRNGLVALGSRGNLVLIEVKRDGKNMSGRAEALEFQAIRHAASLAAIADTEDLVEKRFARQIRKHAGEF